MKNKKAQSDSNETLFIWTIIGTILIVTLLILIFLFINSKSNGSEIWEDYYTKELKKIIELSDPGTEISLNIQKLLMVASANGIISKSEIFIIHNQNNEFCLKTSLEKSTCINYYNQVDIAELPTEVYDDSLKILITKKLK
jgi:hypothetical protein